MSAATTSAAGRLTDGELKAREKAARKRRRPARRGSPPTRPPNAGAARRRVREREQPEAFHVVDRPVRGLRRVLPVPVRLPFDQRDEDAGRLHQYIRPGLRQDVRPVRQHRDRVHIPGRHLRALAAQHAPVRGGRRGGATLLAIMGGYALAKFRFPGRKAVFAVIIGAISVPGIALAVPQFLLFAKLGLTNTPWAMIIPSLISRSVCT